VVAQPFVPGIATPYVIVRVSLSGAPEVELVANIVGKPTTALAVGAQVHIVYDEVDDDLVLANFELVANVA